MMGKKQSLQMITCPVCNGTGKNKYGFSCSNCAGMGLGHFFQGRFYYWGMRMGRAVIEMDHIRKKINFIINLTAFIFGLAGLLSLAYWVFVSSSAANDLGAFAFWRERSNLILFFWYTLYADMFIIYRLSEESRKKHRIRSFRYEDLKNQRLTPNNWEELKKAKSKLRVNVFEGFEEKAIDVIEYTFLLASKLNHRQVTPMHLFFTCIGEPQVVAILSRLNVDVEKLTEKIKEQIIKIDKEEIVNNTGSRRLDFSNELKEVLIEAYLNAAEMGQPKVTVKNFIIPCLEKNEILEEILYDLEVDRNKIYNVILWFIINEKLLESYRAYRRLARFKPSGNMDRAYTSVATPILDHFAYDLTAAAKSGRLEFCVAQEENIEKIWQNFESGASGVVLVGQVGVGKSTIIGGIAQMMVREDVPKFFRDKRLVEIDAARLISGATPAEAQGRLVEILDEVVRAGNIIVYIKDIENLIGITSGGESSLDLSQVLSGAIERHAIYCLASATTMNYSRYLEGTALGEVMARVEIKEPIDNQAIQIIESKIGFFEGKYKVYFSYNAIEEVIKLSSRYIKEKYLPEKAISLLESVAIQVSKEKGEQSIVAKADIAQAVSEKTGIPVTEVSEAEGEKLLNLEGRIHERMINQVEAVKAVSASLRRARTQLRESNRPIANFLFLGPTGVGKTELAKSVSEIYFGSEKYMIRIDMSEYQQPDSVNKMIGDSDGARGYLTEAVRKAPYSLVLLDEVEKAHPDILNLFLQVMDDGRLTDGQGLTIDFTNSIIIATSNAGAPFIQEQILAGTEISQIKEVLINEHLNKVMRPELINRFDGVIVFTPLSMEHVVEIAHLMLNKIGKMLDAKGISFEVDENGLRKLAELGYDPKFGARPLRRVLQEKVEDSIANLILGEGLTRRDTVVIDSEAVISVRKGREL